jgi:hypothetical protein
MFADRVKESTTTTGTGTVNLGGAATGGFQTFVAGIGDGKCCYYCIQLTASNEWEVGIGTVTDAVTDTLSREVVLASSNAGALVNFSAGSKDVFCTIPAAWMELPYSQGTFCIVTEQAKMMVKSLKLTGTQRVSIFGTGRLRIIN